MTIAVWLVIGSCFNHEEVMDVKLNKASAEKVLNELSEKEEFEDYTFRIECWLADEK